jgi:hypothetical protein
MQAAVALTTLERALRQLMEHAYAAKYGQGWVERISTPDQRSQWDDRARAEEGNRRGRGVHHVPPSGLDYADLYALRTIIEKDWSLLPPL